MSHTPGPWEPVTGGMDALVRCPDGRTFNIGDAIYHGQESKANANLIAAAPDLLVALEECLEGSGYGWISTAVEERARAAIAKARGES